MSNSTSNSEAKSVTKKPDVEGEKIASAISHLSLLLQYAISMQNGGIPHMDHTEAACHAKQGIDDLCNVLSAFNYD